MEKKPISIKNLKNVIPRTLDLVKLNKQSTAVWNLPDCLCITDDNYRLKYVASSFTKMVGYSPKDLLGKHLFSFFPAKWSRAVNTQLKKAPVNDKITFQICLRHKSGSVFPIHLCRIPFPVNQSFHYLYLTIGNGHSNQIKKEPDPVYNIHFQKEGDMRNKASHTDQNHIELLNLMKELHTNSEYPIRWQIILKRLKKTIHYDSAIVYLYDHEKNTIKYEAGNGLSVGEIRKAKKSVSADNWKNAIENGEPLLEVTVQNSSRSGSVDMLHNVQSCLTAPLKIVNHVLGILELRTNKKLGYSQKDIDTISIFSTYLGSLLLNYRLIPQFNNMEKYKQLFNKANIPIFFCRKDGRLIGCNPAFQELLGFTSRKQTLKSNLFNHIQLYPNGKKTFRQLIRKCGFFINLEILLRNTDKKSLPALISIEPSSSNEGQIIGYEGTLQDISEKRKQKEELIQAQKMITIGSLTGGIIHDFNNLLGGIMGCASMIMGEMSKRNKYYQDVETIFTASKKAAELTADVLSFSRKDKHQVKTVSINDIISEVIHILSRTIDKSIQIKLNLFPDVVPIEVDASRIQQTLMNICINARDAMPAGGDLIIETENVIVDKPFNKPHLKINPGTYILVKISDTGIGIPPDTMDKIFEPFFTTKTRKNGSGLGLAIAYEIVKNHNGGIHVESSPDGGTTFGIYLPASNAHIEQRVIIPDSVSLPKGSETILLADDEELIRNMGKRMLEKFGYKVLVADDGEKALEMYREKKDQIDALILDIIMPKLDGIKAFMEIKKINPNVKVLLSTGSLLNGKETKLRKQGVAGLLQKPFLASEMLKILRQTLD